MLTKLLQIAGFSAVFISTVIAQPEIYFQAHRGAVDEAPENTLAALKHAWSVPGAVPEIDLRTTKDGVIICLHDTSLFKTTNVDFENQNNNIKNINFDVIKILDAGTHFNKKFKGEKIPTLDQVLDLMYKGPNRFLYLDVKDADLKIIKLKLEELGLEERIIFCHGEQSMLKKLKRLFPQARTMTWLSGEPDEIKQEYENYKLTDFDGIDQLQFHLKTVPGGKEIKYVIDDNYLQAALDHLNAFNVQLQVRPFEFNPTSMRNLINIGIRWYVTDGPEEFANCIKKALVMEKGR